MTTDSKPPLLELRHVSKRFVKAPDAAERIVRLFQHRAVPQAGNGVQAVDNVSLSIAPGEVVGLVGESGCGKSTLGRMAVGLLPMSSGERRWKGENIDQLPATQRRQRQIAMQLIFQDPYASLNPRMRVHDIIGEAPVAHGMIPAARQKEVVQELLQRVGLDPAMANRYPHQFSGGQRARVGIARALAVNPEMLVCDEAVAALDVSIQAQVLNLFIQLRNELDLTYLFISHDLAVVRHLSDRVLIMYGGRIVESAPTEELFAHPHHPYTQMLLASAPTLDGIKVLREPLQNPRHDAGRDELPGALQPPSGCHSYPRCPHATDRCRHDAPALREVSPRHFSACHRDDAPR